MKTVLPNQSMAELISLIARCVVHLNARAANKLLSTLLFSQGGFRPKFNFVWFPKALFIFNARGTVCPIAVN
jgi:hypothetical protein